MRKEIIYTLKLVWDHFKKFANRFVFLILIYGRFAFIFLAASILIPSALHRYLGLPHDVAMTIMKILLTVTPIFPTAICAKFREEEDHYDECSMDLCFAVWVITIMCAWFIT